MVYIEEIIREFRQGASVPVLARASDGAQYVIRWGNGQDALAGVLADVIASRLVSLVYPTVPAATFVQTDDRTVVRPVDQEVREMIGRNRGCNAAVAYVDGASEWRYGQEWQADPELRDVLFLFDLLVLNIDRTQENCNILWRDGQYYPIDFTCSMALRSFLTGTPVGADALCRLMNRHPFYRPDITVGESLAPLAAVERGTVGHIVQAIPDSLAERLEGFDRTACIDRIVEELRRARDVLGARLDLLRSLPPYSPQVRKTEALQNRRAFEALLRNDNNRG